MLVEFAILQVIISSKIIVENQEQRKRIPAVKSKKIPLKLRQVSREASAWTAEAKHAPGTSTGRPEGWHEWLNKVTTFFKPSSSGDSLNPTDVHTLSFYEDLIDKLDRYTNLT